jgi:hypothetical protein
MAILIVGSNVAITNELMYTIKIWKVWVSMKMILRILSLIAAITLHNAQRQCSIPGLAL